MLKAVVVELRANRMINQSRSGVQSVDFIKRSGWPEGPPPDRAEREPSIGLLRDVEKFPLFLCAPTVFNFGAFLSRRGNAISPLRVLGNPWYGRPASAFEREKTWASRPCHVFQYDPFRFNSSFVIRHSDFASTRVPGGS
jgi:hypothetical protein